jgi:hypothetical protein
MVVLSFRFMTIIAKFVVQSFFFKLLWFENASEFLGDIQYCKLLVESFARVSHVKMVISDTAYSSCLENGGELDR